MYSTVHKVECTVLCTKWNIQYWAQSEMYSTLQKKWNVQCTVQVVKYSAQSSMYNAVPKVYITMPKCNVQYSAHSAMYNALPMYSAVPNALLYCALKPGSRQGPISSQTPEAPVYQYQCSVSNYFASNISTNQLWWWHYHVSHILCLGRNNIDTVLILYNKKFNIWNQFTIKWIWTVFEYQPLTKQVGLLIIFIELFSTLADNMHICCVQLNPPGFTYSVQMHSGLTDYHELC